MLIKIKKSLLEKIFDIEDDTVIAEPAEDTTDFIEECFCGKKELPSEEEILAEPIRFTDFEKLLEILLYSDTTIKQYKSDVKGYFKGLRTHHSATAFNIYKHLFGYDLPKMRKKDNTCVCITCGKEFHSSQKHAKYCCSKCYNQNRHKNRQLSKLEEEYEQRKKEILGE